MEQTKNDENASSPGESRPLWPRDTPPGATPKARQRQSTRSGNQPAGPCSARRRELAGNGHRWLGGAARDAEIPRANDRSAPQPALPRPPLTRQTVRKGRLNFLHFLFS